VTQEEYVGLAAACDALLLDAAASSDRLNVAWLHLMSEHPTVLRRYAGALRGRGPDRSATVKEWLRMARLVTAGRGKAVLPDALPKRADVLIVSHLVNPGHTRSTTDFYFGDLPNQLAAAGSQVVLALLNHAPGDAAQLGRELAEGTGVTRVLLPRAQSVMRELQYIARARSQRRELRAAGRGTDTKAAVARAAAAHAVSIATLAAMRIASEVGELARRLQPRMLLLTHEGHAWERAAMRAARATAPGIRCVGYQHTILFPQQHAIARGLAPDSNPDLILTIGDSNAATLAHRPALAGTPVAVYGSHRRAQALPLQDSLPPRCLVLPEGLEAESLALYEFAIRCARDMPDFDFVLRAHPVLPARGVLARHPGLGNLPPNVQVSDEPDIGADFRRCGWALYRGSSAAIHAVLAGLLPVYLALPGELPIDPLFTLDQRPAPVATPRDFADRVATQAVKDANIAAAERRAALSWGHSYVVPPRHALVAGLLAAWPDNSPAERK
jgi:hypothetical protein